MAALTVATGAAQAQPGAVDQPVSFTAHATDSASIIEIDHGSLAVDNGVFEVRDSAGTVVAASPLTLAIDDFQFPIRADIVGRTATLTPELAMDKAVYKPIALPFEDKAPWKSEYDREQAAWSRMTSTIGMGASIGTLVGGLGGAAVGCVLGGIAGATIAAATIVGMFGPFIPAAALGCLGGVLAIGALGTVAGQILVTAPVAVGAVIQYLTTINQPFVAPAK
ncbi:MAG: hypothetical protein H5T78_07565 [Nocardia sp.]|nr:hypothetical protein [Nocardia sp.]